MVMCNIPLAHRRFAQCSQSNRFKRPILNTLQLNAIHQAIRSDFELVMSAHDSNITLKLIISTR